MLASIAEQGIAEPLEGVDEGARHVLLNGFKRWRCARKLGLATAPYVSLGEDAAVGIVALLRASNDRALSLLEQAGFVDELKRAHGMTVALSGKRLSVREIDHLAHGYFRGPESLREQIRQGNVALPLEQLKREARCADGCNAVEQAMLKDLEIAQKYLQRVTARSHDPRLKSPAFHAQAQLLLSGLLSRASAFFQSVRLLHDRSAPA